MKEQMHDFGDGKDPVPFHIHTNGGGWVADTAKVHNSAYIGPDARVSGAAQVYGNARVSGDAWVSGDARVSGDVQVFGNARVCGDVKIFGNAWVHGAAQVYGNARVSGDAWVSGDARVSGAAQVNRGMYTSTPTSITRSDGYMFTLQSDGSIVAGCRDFTPDEAKAHWGRNEHHKHRESMAIVTALNAIAAERQ